MTVQVDIPVGKHIALCDGWTPGSRSRLLKWSGFIKSRFANSRGSRGSVQLLLLGDFHALQHCKLLFGSVRGFQWRKKREALPQLWPWVCSMCVCPWLCSGLQHCGSLLHPACPTRSLVLQVGWNPVIPCVETCSTPSSAKDSWTLDHKGLAWKGPRSTIT